MCQVHLVPIIDELRLAADPIVCCECKLAIKLGEHYRHVEGELDDGSTERMLYRAHDDCYQLSTTEVSDSGCFTFNGAIPMCVYCTAPVEGEVEYRIHRDGFGIGPELVLCVDCGSHPTPTCEEIWDRISRHDVSNVTSLGVYKLFKFLKEKASS